MENISWKMLPTTATPEMAAAPFKGMLESQACEMQARNREAMATNYAKMIAAAPEQPVDPVVVAMRLRDNAEAAELQSWLVGNARSARPVDQSGLMAWALAALVKVTAERDALQGVERYTSVSKGGEYALVGTITGAGKAKGLVGRAYRNTLTGQLFFREPECFAARMRRLDVGIQQ